MFASPSQTTPRRGFLRRMTAGALALAAAPSASALALSNEPPPDERWLARIKGKHKELFDSITINDGFGLVFAMNFLNSNNEAYGLPDSQLTAVVGLRHFSIPIGFTDPIWAKYKLGAFFKVMDPATKAPAERNIFYKPHPGDLPFPGMSVDALQSRGTIFYVCNVALTVISGITAKAAGVPEAEAKAEWLAGIIPDMVVVPSGVLGVNRAQEQGCTYCYAG
jgi:intracellular sulfur oxidation DsrE/DsrF family protein